VKSELQAGSRWWFSGLRDGQQGSWWETQVL